MEQAVTNRLLMKNKFMHNEPFDQYAKVRWEYEYIAIQT